MTKEIALGIFFRIPERGKVKKRLAAEIGEDNALKAYETMLKATTENVSRLRGMDLYGFYEGEMPSLNTSSLSFNSASTSYDLTEGVYRVAKRGQRGFARKVPIYPQKGADLSEKMFNAVKWLFNKGYKKISLIGADSPDLPLFFVEDAFQKLDTYNIVMGPSEDGGYYLIGMNKPYDIIFKDIQWGNKNVLQDSITRAKAAGISFFLLNQWYDIDDRNSLNRWKRIKSDRVYHRIHADD